MVMFINLLLVQKVISQEFFFVCFAINISSIPKVKYTHKSAMYKNNSWEIIQYSQYITSVLHLNDNTKEIIGSKRFIIKHVILEYIKYKLGIIGINILYFILFIKRRVHFTTKELWLRNMVMFINLLLVQKVISQDFFFLLFVLQLIYHPSQKSNIRIKSAMYKNKSREIIQYSQYITSVIHLNDNTKEMIGSKIFIIKHVILEYTKYKSGTIGINLFYFIY